MKAAVINQHITDFKQIDFKEVNVPQLRPGTALVKVVAASINPVDKLITFGYTGGMGWVVPFHYIPGEDYAGVVHAVADDVTNVKVGDEVFVSNLIGAKADTMTLWKIQSLVVHLLSMP